MSLLDTASLLVTPNAYKASKLYSVIPSDGSGDMSVVRATTTTRVNSAGLVESVATDVPRLDYSLGGCPSLLVEPHRTNLLTYSEDIALSLNSQANTTVTSNAAISPNGILNADNILFAASSYRLRVLTISATTNYTASLFFKNVNFTGTEEITLNLSDGVYGSITATIIPSNATATFTRNTIGWSSVSGKVEDFGNGWYRVSVSGASIGGGLGWYEIGCNVSKSILIWGLQLEAGSYATSYIPTTTASVTRNADAISKTGISSLIGQTEGTVFWEGQVNGFGLYPQLFDLNADGNKFIQIYNDIVSGIPTIGIYVQNVSLLLNNPNIATIAYNTHFKFALGYKNNDYVAYLNGVQVFANTTIGVPPTSNFGLGDAAQSVSSSNKNVKATALWKTRLTNAQLSQLTTI